MFFSNHLEKLPFQNRGSTTNWRATHQLVMFHYPLRVSKLVSCLRRTTSSETPRRRARKPHRPGQDVRDVGDTQLGSAGKCKFSLIPDIYIYIHIRSCFLQTAKSHENHRSSKFLLAIEIFQGFSGCWPACAGPSSCLDFI